ncbi:MAG: BamA/TamA family outer membrane protein, partial [Nitrospirae bacterium]|nr:BamA/TamA family outer membrane protein [Nitrospirota bacterium]
MTRSLFFAGFFLLILLAPPVSVAAEEPSAPGDDEGKTISALEVKSRLGITAEDLERRCGLRKGGPFSIQGVRSCMAQFYRTGLIRDAAVETFDEGEGSVRVVFTFVEKKVVGSLRVEGGTALSSGKILAASGLKPGEEVSEEALGDAERRVLAGYREQGYFEAHVRVAADLSGEGRKVPVTFHVEEGPRATVSRIFFPGNRVWGEATLLALLETRPGKPYRRDVLEEDLRLLGDYYIQQGYLRSVVGPMGEAYDPQRHEVTVTIPVEAGPRVEVRLEGNEAFSRERLTPLLTLREERSFDELVLEGSVRRLREFYQEEGYYLAAVTYSRETPDPDHVRIVFHIEEGHSIAIRRIVLEGNRFFPEKRLRKLLKTREDGKLQDDTIRDDAEAIRLLYQEEGFIDAKVRTEMTFDPEKTAADLRFAVEEGERVFIGEMVFEGNAALTSEEIAARMVSQAGRPYHEGRAREDRYAIQALYAQKGYIYAEVTFRKEFSFDRRYALLTYVIKEDLPVTLGNIYLQGNDYTRSRVILRELTLQSGDPFDYERILLDQRRIRRLGFFRDARLDPLHPEVNEPVKDLLLRVEEGRPGSVEFGVGYGDVERFRGSFEVGHRNLDLIEDKISFERRTLGAIVGVEKSFGEKVQTSVLYQYEDVALSDVQPEAVLIPEDTGKVRVATINPSLAVDLRDDPFNPTAGAFYSATFREAAKMLGAKPQFVKVS